MNDDIRSIAFEWSTDYKPFNESLGYREYAEEGFVQGYTRASQEYESKMRALLTGLEIQNIDMFLKEAESVDDYKLLGESMAMAIKTALSKCGQIKLEVKE